MPLMKLKSVPTRYGLRNSSSLWVRNLMMGDKAIIKATYKTMTEYTYFQRGIPAKKAKKGPHVESKMVKVKVL